MTGGRGGGDKSGGIDSRESWHRVSGVGGGNDKYGGIDSRGRGHQDVERARLAGQGEGLLGRQGGVNGCRRSDFHIWR